MAEFKKIFILIFVFFIFVTISGCNKKEYTINVISEEEIMNQKESEYYIFFYKNNCVYCDDIFNIIDEYLKNPKELPLYVCKIEGNSLIDKKLDGGTGQGPSGNYVVDWVNKYENLSIAGVPSLIKKSSNGYCFYVTSGKKNIIEYFEKLNNIENLE